MREHDTQLSKTWVGRQHAFDDARRSPVVAQADQIEGVALLCYRIHRFASLTIRKVFSMVKFPQERG